MSKCLVFLVFLASFQQTDFANGANIMFYFSVGSYSHRVAAWPLVEAFADRGHSVTFVSPFPPKTPNPKIREYNPVVLQKWFETFNESGLFYQIRLEGRMDYEWYYLADWGIGACEVLMGDDDFLNFIRTAPRYDLIIVDALVNECAYGIAHYHKSKLIVYNTANAFPWYVDPFGLPDESSWVPDPVFHYDPSSLSIFQRAVALFNPIYFMYLREYKIFPKVEQMLRSSLVPDMPSLAEIERNVSLIFLNHHFAEDFPRPFPPNFVNVAGLHYVDKPQTIPKEIESFINDAKDGFVYMSFGSYAEIMNFPKHIQQVFFKTFANMTNMRIIWKMNVDERPEGLPDNVLQVKWVPQQAILSHPKIRAFITHGGLLGLQEAIWNGVPVIAFPVFAEQDYNAMKIVWRKIGLKLEISSVTEQQFQNTLEEVINNDMYAKNMKRQSKLFRDRPISPLDNAVWWTEWVLRHDDTSALRPLSAHQSWWKRRQLDIWALVFITIAISSCVFITIVKIIFSACRKGDKRERKQKRS